jgi:hypothetical protein
MAGVIPCNLGQKYIIISKYPPFNFGDDRVFILGFAAILSLSIALQVYASFCGLILTDDSLNYLSAARSFSATREFRSPDGTYFVAWPPLFPVILSLFQDPEKWLWIMNVVLKIFISVTMLAIAQRFIAHRTTRLIFLLVSLCGVHIVMISAFLWSELVFMLLLLSNFVLALKLTRHRTYVILFFITGFLLCLQRNAGVFYIIAVSLWLVFDTESTRMKTLRFSAAFFILSISGLSAWVYHVNGLSNEFSFTAYRFLEDPLYNVTLILSRIGKLFIVGPGSVLITTSLGILLYAGYILRKRILIRRDLQLLLMVVITYVIGLLTVGRMDPHEMDRYLSVIIPFLYVFVFAAFDHFIQSAQQARIIRALTIAAILWSLYPLSRTYQNAQLWYKRSCLTVLDK